MTYRPDPCADWPRMVDPWVRQRRLAWATAVATLALFVAVVWTLAAQL